MSDKTWKKQERRVADFFGTTRTPLSGENSKHNTGSDTLHDNLYIECKYRKNMSVLNWMKSVEIKAREEDKIPVLSLKSKTRMFDYFLIRRDHLDKLVEERLKCMEVK